MTPETKRAIDAAALRSARAAVKETLLTLGIDASTPAAIQEFQQDVAHLRRTRLFSSMRSVKLVLAGIGMVVALLGSLATMALQKLFGVGL